MDLAPTIRYVGPDPLLQFALASHKSLPQVTEQVGRGAVRHVIVITPPATAQGGPGSLDSSSEAKQRGYASINRDLNIVFSPVRIKGKRPGAVISGLQLRAIHLGHLKKKRPGAAMRRDRAQPYYVDRRLLNKLHSLLRSHVGRLAAGWMAAATALDVAVPSWISRHGTSRGSYRSNFDGDIYSVVAINDASPGAPVEELRRRVPYAQRYAYNDLRRQIPYIMRKQAAQLGFGMGLGPGNQPFNTAA